MSDHARTCPVFSTNEHLLASSVRAPCAPKLRSPDGDARPALQLDLRQARELRSCCPNANHAPAWRVVHLGELVCFAHPAYRIGRRRRRRGTSFVQTEVARSTPARHQRNLPHPSRLAAAVRFNAGLHALCDQQLGEIQLEKTPGAWTSISPKAILWLGCRSRVEAHNHPHVVDCCIKDPERNAHVPSGCPANNNNNNGVS